MVVMFPSQQFKVMDLLNKEEAIASKISMTSTSNIDISQQVQPQVNK